MRGGWEWTVLLEDPPVGTPPQALHAWLDTTETSAMPGVPGGSGAPTCGAVSTWWGWVLAA